MISGHHDSSFLLIWPILFALLFFSIAGLAGFLAWDYWRDKRRRRA